MGDQAGLGIGLVLVSCIILIVSVSREEILGRQPQFTVKKKDNPEKYWNYIVLYSTLAIIGAVLILDELLR